VEFYLLVVELVLATSEVFVLYLNVGYVDILKILNFYKTKELK